MQWTPEEEIQLFFALDIGKPVGVHKHFRLGLIAARLSEVLKREISSQEIWNKLLEMYDMDALHEMESAQFLNEYEEFSLPRKHFVGYSFATKPRRSAKNRSISVEDVPTNLEMGTGILTRLQRRRLGIQLLQHTEIKTENLDNE